MDVPCIDTWTKLAFFAAATIFIGGVGIATFWIKRVLARRFPEKEVVTTHGHTKRRAAHVNGGIERTDYEDR